MFSCVMIFRLVPLFMILALEMLSASMFLRRKRIEQMLMIRQSMLRNSAFSSFAVSNVRLRCAACSCVCAIEPSSGVVPRWARVMFAGFISCENVVWSEMSTSLGREMDANVTSLLEVMTARVKGEISTREHNVCSCKNCFDGFFAAAKHVTISAWKPCILTSHHPRICGVLLAPHPTRITTLWNEAKHDIPGVKPHWPVSKLAEMLIISQSAGCRYSAHSSDGFINPRGRGRFLLHDT